EDEEVCGSARSKNGNHLLLLVNGVKREEREAGVVEIKLKYRYLVLVSESVEGGPKAEKLMDSASSSLNTSNGFVSALGEVSDDGNTAIIRFAEGAPARHAWQVWDLKTSRMIRE